QVEVLSVCRNSIRDELQIAARRNVGKADRVRELRHEPLNTLRDVGPIRLFVVALDDPPDGDSPALFRRAREPEALEWNPHPDDVPRLREFSLGFPQRVEAVVVLLTFGEDAVELDAERIGREVISTLPVAE